LHLLESEQDLGLVCKTSLTVPVSYDYPEAMVKAFVYDRWGYVYGEPEVPSDPPQIIIWGDEVFLAGCPTESGRPQYYACPHFVVPDTRARLSN